MHNQELMKINNRHSPACFTPININTSKQDSVSVKSVEIVEEQTEPETTNNKFFMLGHETYS